MLRTYCWEHTVEKNLVENSSSDFHSKLVQLFQVLRLRCTSNQRHTYRYSYFQAYKYVCVCLNTDIHRKMMIILCIRIFQFPRRNPHATCMFLYQNKQIDSKHQVQALLLQGLRRIIYIENSWLSASSSWKYVIISWRSYLVELQLLSNIMQVDIM